MKYLYDELEKLQPNLIKLATETDDNDESIGDILKANDSCESVLKRYQSVLGGRYIQAGHNDDALVNLNTVEDGQEDDFDPLKADKTDSTKDLYDLFSSVDLNQLYLNKKKESSQVMNNSTPNLFDDLKLLEQQPQSNSYNMSSSNSLNSFVQLAPLQPVVIKTDSENSLSKFFLFSSILQIFQKLSKLKF